MRKRNGWWQVQIRRDGHLLAKTFHVNDDAQNWAREHERLIDLGEVMLSALLVNGDKLTFEDLLKRYSPEAPPKKRAAGPIESFHLRAVLRHPIAALEAAAVTLVASTVEV